MRQRNFAGMGLMSAVMVWLVLSSCSSHKDTTPKNTPAADEAQSDDASLPPPGVPMKPPSARKSGAVSQAAQQSPEDYFRELKTVLVTAGFEIFKNEPTVLGVNHKDIFKTFVLYIKKDNVLWLVSLFGIKQGHKCGDKDLEAKLDLINTKYNMKDKAGYSVFAVTCMPKDNAVATRLIIPFTPSTQAKKKDMPRLLSMYSAYIYKTFSDSGLKPFLQ